MKIENLQRDSMPIYVDVGKILPLPHGFVACLCLHWLLASIASNRASLNNSKVPVAIEKFTRIGDNIV